MIEKSIVLMVMAVISFVDIKRKQVSLAVLIPIGAVVLIWKVFQGTEMVAFLTGLVPGVACLLLSYVTGESIGRGDGLVLCILGLLCGMKATLAVFGLALTFSAIWAIFLLILRRAGRKTELPFLPCLSLGYLVYALV